MIDLTQLTDTELREQSRAFSAEINRRADLARIPIEITELATQGRQIGVEEQVMVDAVTHIPDPEPEPE